ncbi:MAG: glycosyltransferase [Novosphingobium sp.]
MIWGVLALAIWLGLLATGFWLCTERDDAVRLIEPALWPEVVAVIPARNEADVIARSLGSVAAQDYPGPFRVVLVDDNSGDGTGTIARGLGGGGPSTSSGRADVENSPQDPLRPSLSKPAHDIRVLQGAPLAQGWTGKLWALSQGIAQAGTPRFLWLTDADIEHAPDTLRRLVGIALTKDRRLVSFMAKLHCQTWPERALVPAFIWFFMMLYPFNWINRRSPVAGAAGGCVLVERAALEAAGGIAAMRGALIDDCTLGALIKRQGPIWLGLTNRSRSIRPYVGAGEIAAMISRSAYAQLRYNPAILALTVLGLALVFGLPIALLFASGTPQLLGLATCGLMVIAYQPLLRFYRRSPLWGLALPLVAAFYAWCTLASAWQHAQGRGGMWKGRAQAPVVR